MNGKDPGAFKTKAFLRCGTVACPFFITAVLIEGATRPGYNPLLYPLSSLAIGEQGWMQITNFIFTGLLLLVFAFGLKRVFRAAGIKSKTPLLTGLVATGLIGAGVFVTDPVFGYPANQPLALRQFTLHGHLHDAFSMLVFVCLPWACFVFSKHFRVNGERRWAIYSTITGYAMIAVFILASLGFKQVPGFVNYAGLFQRLCIATGWTWLTLLSLHLISRPFKKDRS